MTMYLTDHERQPWRMCPYCGVLHDGLTGLNEEPNAEPAEGCGLICATCGEWGTLDSSVEGGWRKPTFDEQMEAMASLPFVIALNACREIIAERS